MHHTVRIAALGLLLAAPAIAAPQPPVAAAIGTGIAAIVNDEIVSTLDVETRLKLILATTRLPDTPEVRERLKPQLLRSLIDEALEKQEAARNGIEITEAEITSAVATVEEQRGIPAGALLPELKRLGVPEAALKEQLRAQLAWTRLLVRKVQPSIRISDDELERARRQIRPAGISAAEVQIELLALPIDKPKNEAQVKGLADKLAAEIRGGAPFESLAQQLGGKASGGPIVPFWISTGDLDPALAQAIEKVPDGGITEPVRTADGYTLVKILARRGAQPILPNVTEVVVKEVLLRLRPDAAQPDVDATLALGKEVAKSPGNCTDEGIAGVDDLKDFAIDVHFRRESLQNMSDALRGIVGGLEIGGVSEPVATEQGIRFFMLCEKVEKPAPLADRDETTRRLQQQKLELEAQKYLRGLRRNAVVDVRMGEAGQ